MNQGLLKGCMLLSALVLTTPLIQAQETSFAESKAQALSSFQQSKQTQRDNFDAAKAQYLASFNRVKQELAKKWDNPSLSNQTTWVAYSHNQTVKRSVNFATGEVSIEILGVQGQTRSVDAIVSAEIEQLANQSIQDALAKDLVLAELGAKPSKRNDKVLPQLNLANLKQSAQRQILQQRDGGQVTVIKMKISSQELANKSQAYWPEVNKVADKWSLNPHLIMAIVHTESHFNPVAQSHIPAYGLMQIVPATAGLDVATRYLKTKQLFSPKILFTPQFNLDIGAAYLNILQQSYLKQVVNRQSKEYLSIAAYNGGIGSVAKHFTGSTSLTALAEKVNRLSAEQVYQSLVDDFPFEETRHYLRKVNKQKSYYQTALPQITAL